MLILDASELANDDTAEALAFYGAISPMLAESFDEKLSTTLNLLRQLPNIG